MLTDPLSVTYDGSGLTLTRTSVKAGETVYRTADGLYQLQLADVPSGFPDQSKVMVDFTRITPDPTAGNVFDDYRHLRNSFGILLGFDRTTRADASTVIPLLRTALLALVDTTLQGRIIAGEK